MANWNPNATGAIGLEWWPFFGGVVALDSPSKVAATAFEQTTSQLIGGIQVPNTGIPVRGGIYVVEAYDNENAVSDVFASTTESVPNEDVSIQNWRTQAGGSTSLFATMDEGFAGVSTADYIHQTGFASTYNGRVNTGALSLTGRRILAVTLTVHLVLEASVAFVAGLNIGGVEYVGIGTLTGPITNQWRAATWYFNPATRKPWTIADVQAFDTVDEYFVRSDSHGAAGLWCNVDAVSFQVRSIAEARLAVGTLDDSSSGLSVGSAAVPVWNTATMLTPTGGTWTKDGSGRHLYTVRRLPGNGSMNVPFLDQSTPTGAPFGLGRSWEIQLAADDGHPTAMLSAVTRLTPFVQRTTAPANSVDSLPYSSVTNATIFTGRNAEQEFSNEASANYGIIRTVIFMTATNTADLLIKIKRRSDGVQLGGTFTLTAAAYAALPFYTSTTAVWKLLQVQLPSAATLVAATQYYVEFSSTAPSSTLWSVLAANTNVAGQEATYQGTTDAATLNGAESTSVDLLVTVSTIPAAPASMTAALGSQAVDQSVNCVAAIPRADLSWATTSLGGSFLRYEIQRSEDAGATWADVAWITSAEATSTWKDYEARRGLAASYRIRVVRTDLAISAYTAAGATVTKPLLSGVGAYGSSMFLVTNYSPTSNMAMEYRPARDFTFNEADEQQLQGAYGRDYQLGANPIENRGITAHWLFIVGVDDKVPVGRAGWDVFTPLRNLARAQIPYVCVLDHQGNRMLAQLSVPSGNQDASGGGADRYIAEVYGAELAAVPYVATA